MVTVHFYQFLEVVRKWDGLASCVSQILCLIIKSWTSRSISRKKQTEWHCSFMNSYIGVKVLCDNSNVSWLNVSDIDNTLLLAVKLLISSSLLSPWRIAWQAWHCHDSWHPPRCVTSPGCHETWHRGYRSLRSSPRSDIDLITILCLKLDHEM